MTTRLLILGCLVLLAACDSGSSSEQDVEPLEIDGIWVFQHASPGGDDALHGGVAEIKEKCLYVGDAVVVWHEDQVDEATELIARVKAGEKPQISVPGGGVSAEEGDNPIEATITDLCPTRAVWYTHPRP